MDDAGTPQHGMRRTPTPPARPGAAATALALALALAALQPAAATTLDEAIAAALAQAPELAAAEAAVDAAEGRVRQARAGFLPSATATGLAGSGRLDPQGFFGLGAANVQPRAAQIAIEQPLFTGGRTLAGHAQAKAGLAAAEAGVTGARAQAVLAAAQAYGDVLAARRVEAHVQQAVTQMREIERQAQARFERGEAPSTDVAQASARRAEAEAGLARAAGAARSAAAHYGSMVGAAPSALEPLPANPPLPASLEAALGQARAASPALLAAQAARDAAAAGLRGAQAARLPTVGLYAEANRVRDQFFPDYRADGTAVGVRARWELFSGGRISGEVAEARAALRGAEARLESARRQLEEGVIAAWSDVEASLLQERAAAEQERASLAALEAVRHEVRVGAKPQLALLDAQREALQGAAAAAGAATARIVAAYRLRLVTGAD